MYNMYNGNIIVMVMIIFCSGPVECKPLLTFENTC